MGERERQEQHDGDNQQEEDEGQRHSRQQAHHLVDDVQLHIFLLQPEVVLKHFHELRDGFNVLVARQHHAI